MNASPLLPVLAPPQSCTGCGACVAICPTHALTLMPDTEGFLRPQVNASACIGCKVCSSHCPLLQPTQEVRLPLQAYAARLRDADRLQQSSSGGVFTALAESVLRQGGLVFGSAWTPDLQVETSSVENSKALESFRGSKYLQGSSRGGGCYQEVISALKCGREVLFTGTPCQVLGCLASVPSSLRDKLWTAEIVCHGGPSPALFKHYLAELACRFGSRPISVSFRSKMPSWANFSFAVTLADGRHLSWDAHKDPYVKAFFRNLCNRPSCAVCPANGGRSGADFTLGDFWKSEELYPQFNDDRGLSLVLLRTTHAQTLWERAQEALEVAPGDYTQMLVGNPNLATPSPHAEARAWFMSHYKTLGISLAERFSKPTRRCYRPLLACYGWFRSCFCG